RRTARNRQYISSRLSWGMELHNSSEQEAPEKVTKLFYNNPLGSFPLLAAANLLFFCLEFILAIEARSASLFADSIAFLEGASVSVLMSSGRNWSMPGREPCARFSRTIILIPTCFLFWMIAGNYYGSAIPSPAPLAAAGAAL